MMPKMTLNELETLTEDELALALYIVNVIEPVQVPKMEFEPRHLTWFKRDALIQKLLRAVPRMHPEGHPIFISLMAKIGVTVEIKQNPPPCPPNPSENPTLPESSTNTETELPIT